MSKQHLSYFSAFFDFCLTNVNPLLAQVGLYFAIFGRSSRSACFYSRILSIYQETRIANSFLMCIYLLIFSGTRWPLYPGCHYSLLIIYSFPGFSYTTES